MKSGTNHWLNSSSRSIPSLPSPFKNHPFIARSFKLRSTIQTSSRGGGAGVGLAFKSGTPRFSKHSRVDFIPLTRIPSNRERALNGLKALKVRRDFIGLMSEFVAKLATRVTKETWRASTMRSLEHKAQKYNFSIHLFLEQRHKAVSYLAKKKRKEWYKFVYHGCLLTLCMMYPDIFGDTTTNLLNPCSLALVCEILAPRRGHWHLPHGKNRLGFLR